jgi:hypothetical protein
MAEILTAIQPVTNNIISNWKDSGARGTIVVMIGGNLTQVMCDIHTTQNDYSESVTTLMNRIKSEKIMEYVGINKKQKTFIRRPNYVPHKINEEVDPIIIDASVTKEVREWIKDEIEATKDLIVESRTKLANLEPGSARNRVITEMEISELVETMTKLVPTTSLNKWWELTVIDQFCNREDQKLKNWYQLLIILEAIKALGDKYIPKPIEVEVKIIPTGEKYVYRCYENFQIEGAAVTVNIHTKVGSIDENGNQVPDYTGEQIEETRQELQKKEIRHGPMMEVGRATGKYKYTEEEVTETYNLLEETVKSRLLEQWKLSNVLKEDQLSDEECQQTQSRYEHMMIKHTVGRFNDQQNLGDLKSWQWGLLAEVLKMNIAVVSKVQEETTKISESKYPNGTLFKDCIQLQQIKVKGKTRWNRVEECNRNIKEHIYGRTSRDI